MLPVSDDIIDAYIEEKAVVLHLRAHGQLNEDKIKSALATFKNVSVNGTPAQASLL